MTNVLLPLHLALVGLWLGCVLTEALFERALLGKGRDKELILSALHKSVDVFIEIPAFTLVGGGRLQCVLRSSGFQAPSIGRYGRLDGL